MPNTRSQLQAARIYVVDEKGKDLEQLSIPCMFNPFEYSVSKSNSYAEKAQNRSEVAKSEFQKAGPQKLQLTLTFDTYNTKEKADVSKITVKLWELMETKTRQEKNETEKIPPPYVAFEWGVFTFVAVITEMTQKFTLFLLDGTPVRAQVNVSFTQFSDSKDYKHQNPTSGGGPIERIWRVAASDRLDTIAARVYGDATKWRLIAERNRITNPLTLRTGQQLTIPQA
jgi:nucleoid-associated protein YgaU